MSTVIQATHPPVSAWPFLPDTAVELWTSSAQGARERASSRSTGKPRAKNSSCRLTVAELNRAVFLLAQRLLDNVEHGRHSVWDFLPIALETPPGAPLLSLGFV